MSRHPLLLCLCTGLLWSTAHARPSSAERLPDGTDVMLSSMGLVEGADQQRELEQSPRVPWQQPAGAPLLQLTDALASEEAVEDSSALRQLLRRLLPSVSSLQAPRQRRSGGGNGDDVDMKQHQQLTRQLLRRFSELQKRSYPYRSDLLRQARGYMCLSKVCNFKGARGK